MNYNGEQSVQTDWLKERKKDQQRKKTIFWLRQNMEYTGGTWGRENTLNC